MSKEDVRFIAPDYKLKKKIGIELKYIFTAPRVRAAQMVFDEGRHSLHRDCIAHIKHIRLLLEKPLHSVSETLEELSGLALNIRCTADMAAFPIARDLAQILYVFLNKLSRLDAQNSLIIRSLADAINAVFIENRTSSADHLSIMVTREIEENIRYYLDGLPSKP